MDNKVCKENLLLLRKIFYSKDIIFRLGFGTLLGAIRENDFIRGDKDIDLVFEYKYYSKVKDCFRELELNGFKVFMQKKNYILVKRKGVQTDFYFFSERNFFDKLFKRVSCGYGLWCIYIPRQYFDVWGEIFFLKQKFLILPVTWLDYTYGRWWIPENKRGSRSRTFTSTYLLLFRDTVRKCFSKEQEQKIRVIYRGLFK